MKREQRRGSPAQRIGRIGSDINTYATPIVTARVACWCVVLCCVAASLRCVCLTNHNSKEALRFAHPFHKSHLYKKIEYLFGNHNILQIINFFLIYIKFIN
jgi:hypothetical protein